MREDIIEYLEEEVLRRCKCEENKFGFDIYYHIRAVVKNVEKTAHLYNADLEISIISAWLHDIASITDINFYKNHHIYGQYIAEEILRRKAYDDQKIECVKKCIYSHRGSRVIDKESAEEKCVADADASSHFDNLPSLLYLSYVTRNMELCEGVNFVKNKMERSWNKLSDKGKKIYFNDYRETMNVIMRSCAIIMI